MITRYTISFLLLLLIFGCEKQANWKIKSQPLDAIVVDGVITNDTVLRPINLSLPVYELNAPKVPVSGATVYIKYDNDSVLLYELPLHSGNYHPKKKIYTTRNTVYQLSVVYAGKRFTAIDTCLSVNPFDTLKYKASGTANMYELSKTNNVYSSNDMAMYEVTLDWTKVKWYTDTIYPSGIVKIKYYSLPSLDISQVFAPAKEVVKFPLGTIITEKKYSLTYKHAAFIRTLLSETEWRGGYFDVTASNVSTNLSSGGIGFFGASSVLTRRFIVRAK